jgi:hypothetical protein
MVTHTTQITTEKQRARENVTHNEGVGRTPHAFAKFPTGAQTDFKPRFCRLKVGHGTETFISSCKNPSSHPAKIIMLRSQKQECHIDYMKRWQTRAVD